MAMKHTTKVVLVTPQHAAEMLEKNTSNRRIRPLTVRKYAREMSEGRWAHSLDAIGIAPDGTLLNGQHRLSAVVLSGVSGYFTIAEGVDPEVFRFTDSGVKRSAADRLAGRGMTNATRKSATAVRALAILSAWESGDHSLARLSTNGSTGLHKDPDMSLRWAEMHEQLLEEAISGARFKYAFLAALWIAIPDVNKEWFADQVEQFDSKVGIERMSLAHHLVTILDSVTGGRGASKEKMGLVVKATVTGISGRKLKVIRLDPTAPLVAPPRGWRMDLGPARLGLV